MHEQGPLVSFRTIKNKQEKARESLAGSRKMVTVLFADINGFTSLCERLDPEQVRDLIDAYFQRLGRLIYSSEGYIDKFIGDAIMALFGAPIAHENDPELAVRCALKMLEELNAINREQNLNLTMSIGINAGLVIAGGMGTEQKYDFTVMGDAVNLAQRLQSKAQANQILVGKSVFKPCEALFRFQALEPLEVKGKAEKVEAYVVEGVKLQVVESESKLVGRREEIQSIQSGLQNLVTRSQVYFVRGDPGTGKTRLKSEAQKIAKKLNVQWFESKAHLLQQETPYFAFRGMLGQFFSVNMETDFGQEAALAEVVALCLDPVSEALLKEVIRPTNSQIDLAAAEKKMATYAAFRELFVTLAQRKPLVACIEDFHFADNLSIELVDYLIQDLPPARVCLFINQRRDFSYAFSETDATSIIELKPFSAEDILSYVQVLLGSKNLPAALIERVKHSSEGNPLFIREIIRSLIDKGLLKIQGGQWVLPSESQQLDIPTSLQGIVESRIDILNQREKEILQWAAVLGRQFNQNLLSRVILDHQDLGAVLEQLTLREFFQQSKNEKGETEYLFTHGLIQQVAYQGLLHKQRKSHHRRVAESLETMLLGGEFARNPERIGFIAHHFFEAEVKDKFIQYQHEKARYSAVSFDLEGAIKAYLSMIRLLKQERTLVPVEKVYDIYSELADLYQTKGLFEESEKIHRGLIEVAKQSQTWKTIVRAHRKLGDIYRIRGQSDVAIEHLNLALESSRIHNLIEEELRTQKSLGAVYKVRQDYDSATQILSRGLESARGLDSSDLIAEFLNDLGAVSIAQKKFDDAEKYLIEVNGLAAKLTKKNLPLMASINMGVLKFMRQDTDGALKAFQEASQNAQTLGDVVNAINCQHNLGVVAVHSKQFDIALPSFEQSAKLAGQIGDHLDRLNSSIFLGYVKARLGNSEGVRFIDECLKESEAKKFWNLFCEGKLLKSELLRESGQAAEAIKEVKAALRCAESQNIQVLVERCRLALNTT